MIYKKISAAILFSLLYFSQFVPLSHAGGAGHFHADNESAKAVVSKIWWNQKKKITEFSLTEEQRHKMDHDLIEYMGKHNKENDAQKAAFKELAKTLASEKIEKAGDARDQVIKASEDNIKSQINMMIKVLGHLNAKQRADISKKFPALFSRLWIRSANPASMQLGRSEVKRRKNNKK